MYEHKWLDFIYKIFPGINDLILNLILGQLRNAWFFLRLYFYREGKGGRKRSMWEKKTGRLFLVCTTTADQTCNPGICPDRESNQWPFALWDNAKTEPHWSGWDAWFFKNCAAFVLNRNKHLGEERYYFFFE